MKRPRALVVGGGGREHAIAAALLASPSRPEVIVTPGNPGIAAIAEIASVPTHDLEGLARLARERAPDLVVVGPEGPLVEGLADRLRGEGLAVFGPSRAAARIEGSKAFAKALMLEAGVPTGEAEIFESEGPATAWAAARGGRVVVKADGLAAGKGVVVADDLAEAEGAIRAFLGGALGAAGRTLVLEERLEGEEVSLLAVTDGERWSLLPTAQDHKRALDGDRGPNTGGMGAYSPARVPAEAELPALADAVITPVLGALRARGAPFVGVLYAGLMLTSRGPKVLEYNARMGDPEAQVIFPRLVGDVFELLRSAAVGALDASLVRVDPRPALTVVLASEAYPSAPVVGDEIRGLDVQDGPDARVFHAGTARDPRGRVITAGGRVLAVTGMGADLAAARANAYARAASIRWRGMQYRSDIGARALGAT